MVKRYDFALHGDSQTGRYIAREEAKYGTHVEFTDYESLERERDALKQQLEESALKAASFLHQAAIDVQVWGAYASEYFQEKHCLSDDVKLYNQRAEEFLAMTSFKEVADHER